MLDRCVVIGGRFDLLVLKLDVLYRPESNEGETSSRLFTRFGTTELLPFGMRQNKPDWISLRESVRAYCAHSSHFIDNSMGDIERDFSPLDGATAEMHRHQ
jgi:hypothetical protein